MKKEFKELLVLCLGTWLSECETESNFLGKCNVNFHLKEGENIRVIWEPKEERVAHVLIGLNTIPIYPIKKRPSIISFFSSQLNLRRDSQV